MHAIFIIGLMVLPLFSGQAFAQPAVKPPIDAKPSEGLLIDVEKWFQDRPIVKGKAKAETVFQSPRGQVLFLRGKGSYLGRHSHSQVDELVYIFKGRGEVYLNGNWVPCKAGEFHACPRGVVHTVRAAEDEEIWLIVFYTDPLPPQSDRVMIDK